jgi:mono/diheme cytochrome c family protein
MTTCRIGAVNVILSLLAFAVLAQQTERATPLNDAQRLGRRLFQQRCAVCHTPAMVISKPYGPLLDRALVRGREESVRTLIQEGATGLMPGFKYGLEGQEINAIIEYLKTVEPPAHPVTNWTSEH